MKQIGLGIAQYGQDFDELLPLVGGSGGAISSGVTFRTILDPYLKSRQIWQCPSNPLHRLNGVYDGYPISYAVNLSNANGPVATAPTNMGPFVISSYAPYSRHISQIENVSQVIGLVESEHGSRTEFDVTGNIANYDAQFTTNFVTTADVTPTISSLFGGHLSTSNYLFMDGHVKALKPLATAAVAQGGTGALNMWYVDGSNFASATNPMAHLKSPGPFGL